MSPHVTDTQVWVLVRLCSKGVTNLCAAPLCPTRTGNVNAAVAGGAGMFNATESIIVFCFSAFTSNSQAVLPLLLLMCLLLQGVPQARER